MLWLPAGRAAGESAALPATSGTLPSSTIPSKKSTEPVGVPLPGGAAATVAVNVTSCPVVEGLGERATLVVLAILPPVVPTVRMPAPVAIWPSGLMTVMSREPDAAPTVDTSRVSDVGPLYVMLLIVRPAMATFRRFV